MISRFEFSDEDFNFISTLVFRHAGITLHSGKKELVYGRLAKRLRVLGLRSFKQYCSLLKDEDGDEFLQCVNAITTNVTTFFRENHHFDYLQSTLLPELLLESASTGNRSLNIWSAGCSTGQEPYSLAMALREYSPISSWDIRILATDLDSKVLAEAESGVFTLDNLENVSTARRKQFFMKGKNQNEGYAIVRPDISQMISFERLNLIESWNLDAGFDFIFCRNVMIYFDKETRKQLLKNFARQLEPGGYLFVGHSESLSGLNNLFSPVGTTIYRKVA